MNPFLVRSFKRFVVLVIGVGAVYLAVWQVFPFFDHRLPAAIALFATYVLMAYVALPAVVRGIRLFVRPNHIPLYCITPDGFASDPLNIGVIGSRSQLVEAMTKAGWYVADRRTPRTVLKQIIATLFRRPYPTAPFSTLYLFGRKQDIGFELPVDNKPTHRHHVRFWACNLQGPEEFKADVRFWRRFHRLSGRQPNRQLWIGAATKDIGIAPIRHNAQLTHMVDPNTAAERALIVKDLQTTGLVSSTRNVTVGLPYVLQNRALRSFLRSDGKLTICELTLD